jgi:hypothetical protein
MSKPASKAVIVIEVSDEGGESHVVQIPAKYEVCDRCHGHGHHDNPAFANGITSDEWHSPDWDEESREAYIRGDYDVQCTACHGERVMLVADEDSFTTEMRDAWKKHVDACNAMAEEYASERFLRMAESGGRF